MCQRKEVTFILHWGAQHPGGTHMLRRKRMCRNFGPVFSKKSVNMDPIFQEKIPNHVLIFKISHPRFTKMGTFFQKNQPLNMGMGLEQPAAYPQPIQI